MRKVVHDENCRLRGWYEDSCVRQAYTPTAFEGNSYTSRLVHLVTDVWTSVGVVVGIVLVGVTGWLWLDAVVAMAVALNILKEGAHLVWQSSQGLMDEAVESEVQQQIEQLLEGFVYKIDGRAIIRFDHVVTRKAGQRRFVDMHMHMPSNWSLGHAASLRNRVEKTLMEAVPGLRATIQLLPSDVEAHFDDPKDTP
jgi:cation diffusion facilitator family transporter